MSKEDLNRKKLLYDQLYERTKDFGRTQFIKEIMRLERENQQLAKQVKYLKSGEYLNQLKWERNMLEDIVHNGKLSIEDKEFIDMTHRNTELLEENEQLKEQLQHKYDNFPKSVKDLSKEQLESLYLDLLHIENEKNKKLQQRDEVIEEAIKFMKDYSLMDMHGNEVGNYELLEILNKYKGDNNDK